MGKKPGKGGAKKGAGKGKKGDDIMELMTPRTRSAHAERNMEKVPEEEENVSP